MPIKANTIPTILNVGLYLENTRLGLPIPCPAKKRTIPTIIKNIVIGFNELSKYNKPIYTFF
jgi:hypothetical protein